MDLFFRGRVGCCIVLLPWKWKFQTKRFNRLQTLQAELDLDFRELAKHVTGMKCWAHCSVFVAAGTPEQVRNVANFLFFLKEIQICSGFHVTTQKQKSSWRASQHVVFSFCSSFQTLSFPVSLLQPETHSVLWTVYKQLVLWPSAVASQQVFSCLCACVWPCLSFAHVTACFHT